MDLPYYVGKKPSGFIVVIDPSLPGGKREAETRMCAHCGFTWEYKPGSGRKYGICSICGGYICSNPKCQKECHPLAERFELVEMGMATF